MSTLRHRSSNKHMATLPKTNISVPKVSFQHDFSFPVWRVICARSLEGKTEQKSRGKKKLKISDPFPSLKGNDAGSWINLNAAGFHGSLANIKQLHLSISFMSWFLCTLWVKTWLDLLISDFYSNILLHGSFTAVFFGGKSVNRLISQYNYIYIYINNQLVLICFIYLCI